ncbi:MAG: YchJ family protein [Chitinivibrionales bacterium]|nr:YchJ family protein [Chitinivibrionales bacterium]MBD3358508.1 YchJ family protein [Chitinivibrionales bacterium]
MPSCPCNSGKNFEVCCEPYLKSDENPPTAEALMRSRYTAFASGNVDYIYGTIHPDHRKEFNAEGIRDWSCNSEWHGLEIKSTENGGETDTEGTVEFIAHYTHENVKREHHEVAEFRKKDGRWYFVDGNIIAHEPYVRSDPKVGRNDPCPCESGKKFKKCCGKSGAAAVD